MSRLLGSASIALLLCACAPASDDVAYDAELGTATTDIPVVTQAVNAVMTCPEARVVNLDAYPAELLPDTTDFAEWHVQNAARAGVEETSTGLQYKVIQPGIENGMIATPGERVTVHYHGYFPNGEVFDSSYERDETMTHFSNGFIPGWNQSLAEMAVCEARTLYIPADLAYGNSGAGGRPSGTLIFNMQLIGVGG